jgi:shikimate kinase
VLAPGGGWAAAPGNLGLLGPGTLTVWLQVTPEAALQRLRQQSEVRPLLERPDPLEAAARLLEQREAIYRQAELHVPTVGREPAEIARELEHTIRRRLGAAPPAGPQE